MNSSEIQFNFEARIILANLVLSVLLQFMCSSTDSTNSINKFV